MAAVVEIHADAGADDQHIAEHAERIGNLSEEDPAEEAGEDHLRIIVDRNFAGRRVIVGLGDENLSHHRTESCQHQEAQLRGCRLYIIHDCERQAGERGKYREEKHNECSVFSVKAQLPHPCIGKARGRAAERADDRRNEIAAGELTGLHDAQHAGKSDDDAEDLHFLRLFTEQKDREDNGEKGRQFVQHVGIRQKEHAACIEIAEDTQRPEDGPHEQSCQIAFFRPETLVPGFHDDEGKNHGDQISEQCLLKDRDPLSCQLDRRRHDGKAECLEKNAGHTLLTVGHPVPGKTLPHLL